MTGVTGQGAGAATGEEGLGPLGERLRARRKQLKLTLKEVADGAGFSVGFISQIERGITVPSLTSLVAVCRVLGVEVGTFFSPVPAPTISRHQQRPVFGLAGIGGNAVTYERLSARFPGNVLRSTLIHEPPGTRSEPMAHDGEEIFYVIDGALTLEIEGERTILEAGDSAHFPSTLRHVSWNHTRQPATIFHTCTMDVFGDAPEPAPATGPAISRAVHRRGGAP